MTLTHKRQSQKSLNSTKEGTVAAVAAAGWLGKATEIGWLLDI